MERTVRTYQYAGPRPKSPPGNAKAPPEPTWWSAPGGALAKKSESSGGAGR